jgi:hypothetical protein
VPRRLGAYGEAVRRALPAAIQPGDRWHLWHGLAEAVQKEVVLQSPPYQGLLISIHVSSSSTGTVPLSLPCLVIWARIVTWASSPPEVGAETAAIKMLAGHSEPVAK